MDCRRSACIARGNAHVPAPCNVVLTVPVAQATHVPQSSKVVCQSFEQCEGWLQLTLEDRLCVVQATEDFIVHLLEDCNLCAIHAKRVTISKRLFQAAGTTSLQQRSAQHATSAFMFAASCTPLPHHAHLGCIMHIFAASGTPLLYHAGQSVCDGMVSLAISTAVPKDMQLARRIRGPIAGVSSY